jgi:hypothetical protein
MPKALAAQPTITTNEFYYVGDVIQMVNCDPTGTNAGASGSNVSWDFSGLAAIGSNQVTTVAMDTSSVFTTSNLLITLPGGLKQYVQENSSDSYLNGTADTVSGIVTNYYNLDISKRPITYLTNYIDSYRVVVASTAAHGGGRLTTNADAYGILMLPTGTFNNVLRVRKVQSETDSTSIDTFTTTTISYLWFDGVHHPPLLRIDSVIGVLGSSNSITYLSASTGVTHLKSSQGNYQCSIHNDELLLNGTFVFGKIYTVTVYNIIGAKVFSKEFIAEGNSISFDMNGQIIQGIYIVSISQKEDPSDKAILKTVKQ